jgi:phage terminase large subunit-like protein
MTGGDLDRLAEVIARKPWLCSPAHLAKADMPTWQTARHLDVINDDLLDVASGKVDRYLLSAPFRHGKTVLVSHYFPAWLMLVQPDLEVVVSGYGDHFASEFGWAVRDVVRRWGPKVGVYLRNDSKARNRWHIEGRRGGMRAVGIGGGLMGKGFDVFIFDDLIKNFEEAYSPTINERNWNWFMGVVYNRQSPGARIIGSMVRWSKNDVAGRILESAKTTGEKWKVRSFPCVAEKHDELGRWPGELLWPERVGWKIIEPIMKTTPKLFQACYQQKPDEEQGAHFRPNTWPTYRDLGDAWMLDDTRTIIKRDRMTVIVVADWAVSEKSTSDFTAVGAFGLTAEGQLLLLDMANLHLRFEECVPKGLLPMCRKWKPNLVGVESDAFQKAFAIECRKYREIPEVRQLKAGNKADAKLRRALTAIIMGENGRIYRPSVLPSWWMEYSSQLAGFTGQGDERDDDVDVTAYAALMAQDLRGSGAGSLPAVLVPGKAW